MAGEEGEADLPAVWIVAQLVEKIVSLGFDGMFGGWIESELDRVGHLVVHLEAKQGGRVC